MPQAETPRPLQHIAALLPDAVPVQAGLDKGFPEWKGAYALVLYFTRPVTFVHQGRSCTLGPGWLVYAGSAYGPGGVGARLRRHFRQDKKQHWHVDRLTTRADSLAAFALEGGSECAVVHRLLASGEFSVPIDGFGSSDCPSCRAHLLAWATEAGEVRP